MLRFVCTSWHFPNQYFLPYKGASFSYDTMCPWIFDTLLLFQSPFTIEGKAFPEFNPTLDASGPGTPSSVAPPPKWAHYLNACNPQVGLLWHHLNNSHFQVDYQFLECANHVADSLIQFFTFWIYSRHIQLIFLGALKTTYTPRGHQRKTKYAKPLLCRSFLAGENVLASNTCHVEVFSMISFKQFLPPRKVISVILPWLVQLSKQRHLRLYLCSQPLFLCIIVQAKSFLHLSHLPRAVTEKTVPPCWLCPLSLPKSLPHLPGTCKEFYLVPATAPANSSICTLCNSLWYPFPVFLFFINLSCP